MDIFEILKSAEAIIVYKLIASTLIGGFLGYDRSRNGRDAGMKTHAMVCFGSCLVMCLDSLISQSLNYDSTRLAAAVISGIGFLGAGVIIIDNQESKVIGLTTAAGIWVSACLGICIGSNYSWIAIPAVVCFFTITHIFVKIESKIKSD